VLGGVAPYTAALPVDVIDIKRLEQTAAARHT
jgi:hypothetical protein